MVYDRYAFPVPQEKQVRLITDTDAKNEADDQFAVVQALLSPKMDNVGLIAAHFGIDRVADAMEASYHELENILFVIFLGPLTDLASAYLMEPRIANRLTAIWIGGGVYPSGSPEFNLGNDVNAANVVFSSKIELWQVPKNVYEMMPVSLAELQVRVRPYGEIGKYLFDQLVAHSQEDIPRKSDFRTGETWVLGDSPAVGLILYEHRFEFDWVPAPYITQEQAYVHTGTNRPIRVYKSIDSRLILEDMYAKLQLFAAANS